MNALSALQGATVVAGRYSVLHMLPDTSSKI